MKKVMVLRGVPGCGKSTLAYEMWKEGAEVVSADNFFETNDGYVFDPEMLGEAHAQCKRDFKKLIAEDYPYIVVDNTNTKNWEMKWYKSFAEEHDYTVFSIIVENRHEGISEHDVAEETITKMRDRFEIKL